MDLHQISSYVEYKDTRNYMQDIAKVLGKLQQAYLSKQPHDWHRGVMVDGSSLDSPVLEDIADGEIASVDYSEQIFITPWGEVSIANKTADEVYDAIQKLSPEPVTQPKYEDDLLDGFNNEHAHRLMRLLDDATELFTTLKSNITHGVTSPVLLYPHHFDLALAWFPSGADEPQVTFGFSTGDDSIEQPYFYILSWPDEKQLAQLALPDFAAHESDSFKGVLITTSDLAKSNQPETELLQLFEATVAKLTV